MIELVQPDLFHVSPDASAPSPIIGGELGQIESRTRHASELRIRPRDATFRDSSSAPFHSWFQYLEGYSPRFVRHIRGAYLPDAHCILEPFAGSGTTPIVLGQDGVQCGFAEANPAMTLLCNVKTRVLAPEANRNKIASRLQGLANTLPCKLTEAEESADLSAAYAETFGSSKFFTEKSLSEVLRLRTISDNIAVSEDKIVADCFDVAVISCLISCSLLRRAGDLRFMTVRELSQGVPNVINTLCEKLRQMARDIQSATPLAARIHYIGSDSRSLDDHGMCSGYDGVITSPPYLNGTNYIRNARLELWFLRHIKCKQDLRNLRDRVITSGINDVDAHTKCTPVSAEVSDVLERVQESAYDDRITKMVGGYFVDMQRVLVNLARLIRREGAVCIDIGDSVYAGVHVPTDTLLEGIAVDLGFRSIEKIYLRKRRSNGGHELRQTLLVLAAPGPSNCNRHSAVTKLEFKTETNVAS